MNNKSTIIKNKGTRLNIRANAHQKMVIARAAMLRNITISHFVLQEAYEGAQAILGEETNFKLPEEKWRSFCDALDRPPKNIPKLRKLLMEPGIFDNES